MKKLNASTGTAPNEKPKFVPPRLIGICGLIGSGKDTLADAFCKIESFKKLSFADHLKDVAALAYDWDRDLLSGSTAESRSWREEVDPFWGVTPRSALQMMGVKMREIDPDFWVKTVEQTIEDGGDYVIPDVRSANEFDMVRRMGGLIINVSRGFKPPWWNEAVRLNNLANYGRTADMNEMQTSNHAAKMNREVGLFEKKFPDVHISEWGWAGQVCDYELVNDGSIEALQSLAIKIYKGDT